MDWYFGERMETTSTGEKVKKERYIAYLPFTLVGSLEENPLAVKLLDNRLYMHAYKNDTQVYYC